MTTPPPAEAPDGADRIPTDEPGQLLIGPPETRYLVTTPDVVKEAMAFYKLGLRVRETMRVRDETGSALDAAQTAHKEAVEAAEIARAELLRAAGWEWRRP